jgi:hypothetical protein
MPRDYAQIRQDMWSDDRWRNLTPNAQWLYMLLLSDPRLTYCGVTEWHPGRIAQRARECAGSDVLIAAAELSDDHFVVIDEDTEEVAIRSFLKHDPVMRNPRLAVTMAKDFGVIASNKIRAAVVYELQRLKKSEPDLPAWEKPQVKTVLRQNAVNPREMVTDLPVGAATYLGAGLPNGLEVRLGVDSVGGRVSVYQPLTTETATGTATGTSSIEDAADSGSRYPQGSVRGVVAS